MTTTVRHETKALLRAHLSAASSYGHLTPHCAVCSRLLRLAMESAPPDGAEENDTTEQDGATLPG